MKLFKRLPSIRWRPRPEEPFISLEEQSKYPDLIDDFVLLNDELMPHFYDLDRRALQSQNQFWLEQLFLLVGSALATILGAIQIATIASTLPGVLETVITILLAAITYRVRAFNAQKNYFTNRLAAETLRSEYYLFLGRVDSYANEQSRHRNLISRVNQIASQSQGYGGK
ncbi:MAG: hypothetical protein NVS2B12_35180 [Ktedonobacteraceae bacterium]